ncbi:MAG: uncharacterized protein QOG65_1344, partial [Actinomycetota bacterium]|nr:uncharacterized protein [Actinomycetota bacterium]
MSTRPTIRRSARTFAILTSVALVLGLMTAIGASAATPTFRAVGSAEQVYVTGLAPAAQASLVNPAGQTLKTQKANSLGGLLFRNVAPGSGYRVRRVADGLQSGLLTVHNNNPAPWNPGIYNQSIPGNGYTYLTTRDGTKLAIDVHLPTSPAGEPGVPAAPPAPPYPTLIEY